MTARRKTPKRAVRKVNDDRRAHAMRLLAEGMAVCNVAREVGVERHRIRMWRDTPEGQQLLRDARAARAKQFEDAAAQARSLLRESAVKAVQALVDDLAVPSKRGAAAAQILDRIGVLRAEELRITGGVDLSKASTETLAELDRLASEKP